MDFPAFIHQLSSIKQKEKMKTKTGDSNSSWQKKETEKNKVQK